MALSRVDLQRVPPPPADPGPDPELLAMIRAEIERAGPMTFARFMELALYDTERGYYRGAEPRPGRSGDFLTAPEADPIFGRTVARFALAVHAALGRPEVLTIREYGAGVGALAAPLVEALLAGAGADTAAEPAVRAVRYLVAEIEPVRVESVRARVAATIRGDVRVEVEPDDGEPIVGLAIANEVIDALPTHRVVQRGDELREILVDLDPAGPGLRDVEAAPSTPALAARLAAEDVRLADGQRAEVCLALDGWVAGAAAGLERGVLLAIDYGYPASELHDPRRRAAGTLATYRGHTVGADPFAAVGRQDLTAHVDLTAVEAAAAAAGLDLLGHRPQTDFLAKLGIGELLVAEQTRPGATLAGYLETRSAVVRMVDPAAMGRFRVLAFGRGLPAGRPWPGFA